MTRSVWLKIVNRSIKMFPLKCRIAVKCAGLSGPSSEASWAYAPSSPPGNPENSPPLREEPPAQGRAKGDTVEEGLCVLDVFNSRWGQREWRNRLTQETESAFAAGYATQRSENAFDCACFAQPDVYKLKTISKLLHLSVSSSSNCPLQLLLISSPCINDNSFSSCNSRTWFCRAFTVPVCYFFSWTLAVRTTS